MKIKTIFITLSLIIALAAPAAATSFSTFSAPQNMGAMINAADMEQLPAIAPSGLSMYFASNRAGGQGGNDIYVSQRPTLSSAWGPAQNLGAIVNSSANDGIGSLSPDGREMFLQSPRAGGVGGNDLYLSTRSDPNNDFGWSAPVNIGSVINTTLNDYFGNYFVDPATGAGTLYFLSDRNSPGFNDIFISTRNADGTFNTPSPVNELNSAGIEERTAISRDGLEIFFGSNRLGPSTIQAIFVSTRASTSSAWNPPVPVAGLNTTGSNAQPGLSPDGTTIYWTTNRTGGFGLGDIYSATRISVNHSSTADFDGDGRSDVSVFRPSDSTWYVMQSSSNTFRAQKFGVSGDKIVPGDYDGDGRTDMAVFRPTTGDWFILRSSDNSFAATNWGISTDKPVPGDFDGDGRADIAVYRSGTWYIVQSSNGALTYQYFGLAGDIPIASANGQ